MTTRTSVVALVLATLAVGAPAAATQLDTDERETSGAADLLPAALDLWFDRDAPPSIRVPRPATRRDTFRGGIVGSWELEHPEEPLARDATRIGVLVNGGGCSSGRYVRGRIVSPLVHYGREAITVTYFVRPLRGAQTCQGMPPTPAFLDLDEPVNGRRLRDGGD
jgi:hypothetical protein